MQPDPFRWRTAPHLSTRFRAAGFNVLFESNDERLIDAARAVFDPACLVSTWDGPLHLSVQLMCDTLTEDPEWQLRNPVVRTNGSLLTVTYGRHNSIAVDLRAGTAFGFLTEEIVGLPGYLRSDVAFAAVMCWVYVVTNAFVHAAALTRDGRSLLIRGLSGAGKSTLTYAMLKRGFHLISEDALYVHSRTDPRSPTFDPCDAGFFGVPWHLTLLPDALRFFPELADATRITRPDGEVKLVVDVAARFPGQTAPEAPAGPLVFLRQTGQPRSRLRRLSREEVIDHLYETTFAYEPSATDPGGLWGLYLSFPAYLLESSDDPCEAAALLDDAFATDFTKDT